MTLRTKLLAVVASAFAVALVACIYAYVSAKGEVEGLLRGEQEARASRLAGGVAETLRAYETQMTRLAGSDALRDYAAGANSVGVNAIPENVRAVVTTLLADERLASVAYVARGRGPLFRAARAGGSVAFQTRDFVGRTVRFDERVWEGRAGAVVRSPVTPEPYGSGLRTAVAVPATSAEESPVAALVFEVNLTKLFETADAGAERAEGREVFAIDSESGRVVYHTNEVMRSREAREAMPFFEETRARVAGAETGASDYEAPAGRRWLAAFRRVEGLNVSVVATADYAGASAGVRRAGLLGLSLSFITAIAAVGIIFVLMTGAARRIERVSRAAQAVARGELEQHLRVDATGQMRTLIESFNLMSERLREHIAREATTRQFESFVRLSATLTHDIKNAITGLSMLVSNMERLYDREEFRADAIESLRDATDKLKRIVSRLNEPVKSLSGEYRRDAHPTDLVPIIKRVLAMNAFPSAEFYQIETHLPDQLIATVDPERIENVVENLVINALEAMGAKGGKLTVEAGEEGKGMIFISVADTGPGISEEFIRERLFRPFSTTKTKGIGLGLFTCREVVEAHGGRLDVESQPGAGTRFRAVLPSAPFMSRERHAQKEKRTAAAANAISGERGA